jgi:hypothetical protein
MQNRFGRVGLHLCWGLLVLLSLHILLILVLGGYRYRIFGVALRATRVAPPVIALLALLVCCVVLHRRRLTLGMRDAVMIFALSMVVYLTAHAPPSEDTTPTRYLPLSILTEGNFYLDKVAFLSEHRLYSIVPVRDHYVSWYPVGAALLALPMYVPSALGGLSPASGFLLQLEKLAAATIVALSAAILLLVLHRLTTRFFAFVISVVYALGSASLSTSSQALWGHTACQLAIASALYGLVRGRESAGWISLAGLALSFSVICRPTSLLLAVPLGAYVFLRHPRAVLGFVLAGLPPIMFQLWYNAGYFGDPFRTQFPLLDTAYHWSTPIGQGLAGTLLRPGRGLFAYSPVFLLSVVGIVCSWRRAGDPLLRALGIGAIATVLLNARWVMWWGGHCYGPRLLADLSVPLAVLLCPLRDWLKRPSARGLFVALATWSILAHAAGVYWQDGRWNGWPDVDQFPSRLWSWSDNPLVNSFTDLSWRVAAAVGLVPTSRTHRELVTSAYDVKNRLASTVGPRQTLSLAVIVLNDGKALWLSRPGAGEIALEWRWLLPESSHVVSRGFVPLRYDVPPKGHHEFLFAVDAPSAPGHLHASIRPCLDYEEPRRVDHVGRANFGPGRRGSSEQPAYNTT